MKLIKLSENHYIVVDYSEIKEGEFFELDKEIIQNCSLLTDKLCKSKQNKITNSTQPLEGVKQFSISEVEEAINGYNVEKIAKDYLKSKSLKDTSIAYTLFVDGFKAHQELVKDKLFTVSDMINIYKQGYLDSYHGRGEFSESYLLKRLALKTEWDIEFDKQGKIKLLKN